MSPGTSAALSDGKDASKTGCSECFLDCQDMIRAMAARSLGLYNVIDHVEKENNINLLSQGRMD